MPVMRYRCDGCGKEFAKIFFEFDQAPQSCPVCGNADVHELGHAFSQDPETIARVWRGSCESCEDEGGCSVAASS
jgi:putative FmdB family regulatory protein